MFIRNEMYDGTIVHGLVPAIIVKREKKINWKDQSAARRKEEHVREHDGLGYMPDALEEDRYRLPSGGQAVSWTFNQFSTKKYRIH